MTTIFQDFMEQIGINMMTFIFTYPVSSLDESTRQSLYYVSFAFVIIPPFLSCLPLTQIKQLKIFDVATFVFIAGTAVAAYFAYQDDIAPRGREQVDDVISNITQRSAASFVNSTGYADFLSKVAQNAFDVTSYAHVFIINCLSMMAIFGTYIVTRCVKNSAVDLLGLIGSGLVIASVYSVWFETVSSCFHEEALDELQGIASGKNFSGGLDIANSVVSCTFDFGSLEGASTAMVSIGSVASIFTIFLIMIRSGVLTCIVNTFCCCCLGSVCATAGTVATCGLLTTGFGDALVIVGVVIGIFSVSGSHFVSSAWSARIEEEFREQSNEFREKLGLNGTDTDASEVFETFFGIDWTAKSSRELLNGVLVLIPAVALMLRVIIYLCSVGKRACSSSAKTSDASSANPTGKTKGGTLEYDGSTTNEMARV